MTDAEVEALKKNLEAEREKAAKAAEEARKENAELETFKQDHIFQLIVGLKRTTKIPWTVNITTATLDNLGETISDAYPEEYKDNALKFTFNLKYDISIVSDKDLRTVLRDLVETDEKTIRVQVKTLTRPFSEYTLEMVAKIYGLGVEQSNQPVELDIFPRYTFGTTSMRDSKLFSHLVEDLRLCCSTTPLDGAPEAVHSLYVHSFLKAVAADTMSTSDVPRQNIIIRPEKYIKGKFGKGPVDYAITLSNGAIVGVTEVKREDFRKGVAQNAVQIESILPQKRKAEDMDDSDEVPTRSFGIVTNAKEWIFLECTREKGQPKFRLSPTYTVVYGNEDTEKYVRAVVEVIKWLFTESLDLNTTAQDARKRAKLDLPVMEEQSG